MLNVFGGPSLAGAGVPGEGSAEAGTPDAEEVLFQRSRKAVDVIKMDTLLEVAIILRKRRKKICLSPHKTHLKITRFAVTL